ncbi:MAG: toprim domain-containing protein, partial [Shewanella sp.]|nr:toprim domain-containing protein [Shewanella sp.]
RYTDVDLEADAEMAEEGEFLGGSLPSYEELAESDTRERYDPAKAIPRSEWDLYDLALSHPYLQGREIDDQTVEDMHLMVDPGDSWGIERILFPVFDREGNVYGMSGRAVTSNTDIKVRDYQGLDKRLFLLGLHLITDDHDYVVVVEGLFDVARLVQYGEPALGVMCSTLTDAQADWLIELGKTVVLMYDDDPAGDKGVEDAIEKLRDHVPLLLPNYPKREVWNKVAKSWDRVKDPDQLTYDEVRKMIEGAELVA